MSAYLCVRSRAYLRKYRSNFYQTHALVTHGPGSVVPWRRCDTMCTSGCADDVKFAHNGPYGGMSIALQRVTSLRRRAQANAPAASYWLPRILDDGGRRDWTSPLCEGCRGGACCAPLPCNRKRKCADTIGTVPVPWAGHFRDAKI